MSATKVVHKFIRNANIESNVHNRIANRFDPFKNTFVTLQDPKHNRTLTLIGTTNSSNTLAYRTRNLLDSLRPDAVYVQTSWDWWQHAKKTDIDNQKVFTQASKNFPQAKYKFENHLRGMMFRARYLSWKYTFESVLQFPEDFNFFNPGLETYFACKYACKNDVKKIYGGIAFDPFTIEALKVQPDLWPHTLLWNGNFKTSALSSSWTSQYEDFINTLHVRGGQAFAESIDRSRINFFVSLLSRVVPKQKKILVDQRDERIFNQIYNIKDHKNIVAVVNQWHMQGVETHWRRLTGTVEQKPQLSPVHDMDIDSMQQKTMINEWLREYTSEVTKSEPATWQDYSTGYHKENFQFERTRHTHHDSHEDVPEPGQKAHHH